MPELPEVETVVRQLRATVLGRCIENVRLSGLPLRRPIDEALPGRLCGRKISAVSRRGKYIIVTLEPHAFLLIHLGMTGAVFFRKQESDEEQSKHVHAIMRFADGTVLAYRDPRRFGLIAFYEIASMENIPEIAALGKDPLERDFTGRRLTAWLGNCRRDIKTFLLDQRFIAGLGNIYVCEALFLAGIHPERCCDGVRDEEAVRLAAAVRRVLRAAIKHNGTSFSDYRDAGGQRGDNQRFLKVFQREGEPCHRCGTEIRRISQSGRSSFYCPSCQH